MNESVVIRLRPHGRRLVIPCIVLVVGAGGLGVATGGFGSPLATGLGVAGIVLLVFAVGLVPVVVWLRTNYILTTHRVITVDGLVGRREREIDLGDVVDVSARRGPLQSVFGSATIDLTAVTGRRVRLGDVPDARIVTESLRELSALRHRDRVN